MWLSPRNVEVDRRNETELAKLTTPTRTYTGSVKGTFRVDRAPSPLALTLKIGAQVILTQNDTSKHRWVNGSLATVQSMDDKFISVKLFSNGEIVDVEQTFWPDYKYEWNPITGKIERSETGRFTQFPLALAWSMTIHKSQGRTIEKVHLDLGAGAFETGQTYVALSRCRNIEGLSLSRLLEPRDVRFDTDSKRFYDDLRETVKKLPPDELLKKLNA